MSGGSDEDVVLGVLSACIACEFKELAARVFRESNRVITSTRVLKACRKLEELGLADSREVMVRSAVSRDKMQPVRFVWSMDTSPRERERKIAWKAVLLSRHYDKTRLIARHAEMLVEKVCERLRYTRIKRNFFVKKHDIDVLAKHPSNKHWQAISVKNRRDWIGWGEVDEIIEITDLLRKRWKTREVRPAIVASYCYKDVIDRARRDRGVDIAIIGAQLAPQERRRLYQRLNDELAFNFEITNQPTESMIENIRQYICKRPLPPPPRPPHSFTHSFEGEPF